MKGKRLARCTLVLLAALLLVTVLPASAHAANFTVGTYGSAVLWSAPAGESIVDWEKFSCPVPGMECYVSQTSIGISGTPTQAGTWNFDTTVDCTNSGGSVFMSVTVVEAAKTETGDSTQTGGTQTAAPAAAAPAPAAITQNPLDVTVVEGGSASFSANATGWAWCAWRFVSPDGKEEVIFDVVGPKFPGLKVTGGNSLTMQLSDIPLALDGWKAVCLFSNAANNWSYTNGGKITVQPKATPTPEPTAAPTAEPTAAPTAEPTAAPTPAPTAAPTAEPTAAPTAEPTAAPSPVPSPEPAPAADHTLLYVAGAVAAVALICGTVIFLTLHKRRNRR